MAASIFRMNIRFAPTRSQYAASAAHAGAAWLAAVALSGCTALDKCGLAGCGGDAQITAEVNALFEQHPALAPPNLLRVQTLDHVVYLYGLVDTELERQLAAAVAAEPPGVSRVVNSIGLNGNR
jgi:osmotically-inducible protein OsmY